MLLLWMIANNVKFHNKKFKLFFNTSKIKFDTPIFFANFFVKWKYEVVNIALLIKMTLVYILIDVIIKACSLGLFPFFNAMMNNTNPIRPKAAPTPTATH